MSLKPMIAVQDLSKVKSKEMYIVESYNEGVLYLGSGIDFTKHCVEHLELDLDVVKDNMKDEDLLQVWRGFDFEQMEVLLHEFKVFKRFLI